MATVLIIGDGPAALSGALLLARGDQQTIVFGVDGTPMHHAQINNYLGLDSMRGSEFQQRARSQVERAGAKIIDQQVDEVVRSADGRFVATTQSGEAVGDYLLLAAGKAAQRFAKDLGVHVDRGRVAVDSEYRTNIDRVYVVGRSTRPERSQAIISAGAGATAALDILSREAGRDVHDWDNAPEHDHDHPHL